MCCGGGQCKIAVCHVLWGAHCGIAVCHVLWGVQCEIAVCHVLSKGVPSSEALQSRIRIILAVHLSFIIDGKAYPK